MRCVQLLFPSTDEKKRSHTEIVLFCYGYPAGTWRSQDLSFWWSGPESMLLTTLQCLDDSDVTSFVSRLRYIGGISRDKILDSSRRGFQRYVMTIERLVDEMEPQKEGWIKEVGQGMKKQGHREGLKDVNLCYFLKVLDYL